MGRDEHAVTTHSFLKQNARERLNRAFFSVQPRSQKTATRAVFIALLSEMMRLDVF